LNEILSSVDWRRMAKPERDGYDTEITLLLAEHSSMSLLPQAYQPSQIEGGVTICDGRVAVRAAPERAVMPDNIVPASFKHPNLEIGAAYLAQWHKAYIQFGRLVNTVYPYTDPAQSRLGQWALGSTSYSSGDEFGSVHATVDNALGFAQALVKEMAHQKLRAIGISEDGAARLIENGQEECESPVRKGRTWPMTIVFHDQYSFMHVTALDLHMLAVAEREFERQCILMLVARNVPRMQFGYSQIATRIKMDADGRLFLDSFMDWSRAILQRGWAELDANGYGHQ
jgi:HEXXH motif-containing protein